MKNIILRNMKSLVKECNFKELVKKLHSKGLSEELLENNVNYSKLDSDDHRKRCLFFALAKMPPSVVEILVESLRELELYDLANKLEPNPIHCIPFHGANTTNYQSTPPQIRYSTHFRCNENQKPRNYMTTSKRRGMVLIINNFEFDCSQHLRRNGAEADNENLLRLFNAMGGYDVQLHNNKTQEEIMHIVKEFSQYEANKLSDICMVIVMSHGGKCANETVIYTVDNKIISTTDIVQPFYNEECKLFRHKPKIFLFQICRGALRDDWASRTEIDSMVVKKTNRRSISDILLIYPSVDGYKAHRDTIRGSWLIDVMCEVFMMHAHEMHVEEMLKEIDEMFSRRVTEGYCMQTLTYENLGFRNCYLHPGVYKENGILKHY